MLLGMTAPAVAFDGWHLEEATAIPGRAGAWDYLSLDAARGRLFIGRRKDGLQVFDLGRRQLLHLLRRHGQGRPPGARGQMDLARLGSRPPVDLSETARGGDLRRANELDQRAQNTKWGI